MQPTYFLFAQSFTDLQNSFPTLTSASSAWSDYDNDGDLDFVLIGFSGITAEVSSIYRNDGDGVFTLAANLSFQVYGGAVSWGDYDHDGDPDLLVNGQHEIFGTHAITTVYRNDGDDVFTPIQTTLPGVMGTARWIDYDRDGWLDIIISGVGNSFTSDSTRLFHNDTNGGFIEVLTNLPGFEASDISVVDFDNDSYMDIFIIGSSYSSISPIARLYRNNGNGNFTLVPFNFIGLITGTSKWADYDNDGDMDVLYNGIDSTFGQSKTVIYRNDGAGNFALVNSSLPGSGEPGSVDWADVDNDGDPDILLGGPAILLRNDGDNIYTDITPVNFQEGVPNSFADIDNDGDQDILLISQSGGLFASTIYRNNFVSGVVGIKDFFDFFVYPNPTSKYLKIHCASQWTGKIDIGIVNPIGAEVFSIQTKKDINNYININLMSIKPGLYFVTEKYRNSIVHVQKIIVE
jgi:hypothetical protein